MAPPTVPIVTPTVGVEEELVLLHPETGRVVPAAAAVISACRDSAGVVAESMRYVVETRTPVCHTTAELDRSIRRHRRAVADAAAEQGIVAVATGVPPYGLPRRPLVTDEPRYRALERRFPTAMAAAAVCGCHVHVGVPSRAAGLAALLGVRPWLPALVALSANSSVFGGRDSGWASRRFLLLSRWPTAVAPPVVATVGEYDARVAAAVGSGEALDVRSVYYLARLSPRYPTVEVRVGDVSGTAADAIGYAALVRALVATELDDRACRRPRPEVAADVLRRACRSAARHGLGGSAVDPSTGAPVRCRELVDRLRAHVDRRLRAAGDDQVVDAALARAAAGASGADRQRVVLGASRSPAAFVSSLADTTTGG